MIVRTALFGLVLAVSGIAAAAAKADGLPVLGVDAGPSGVVAPGSAARYVSLPAKEDTVVARVEREGGRVLGSLLLQGRFTVPAVAYDGSASGLSADGETLVLIRPRVRFPRAKTAFAIVDARRLRLREVVTLRGDFSFDAISPNGDWLYLVVYVSRSDPTRYRVRAYDLRAGRLLAEPVVDPRERGEPMRGSPITRATSPDGRWAYTLYDGAGEHPFVHALDTGGREARCIDLHSLAGRDDLYSLRLAVSADDGKLSVLRGGEPIAVVDTATFQASEPPEPVATRPRPAGVRSTTIVDRHDDVVPGTLVVVAGAAALVAAGALLFVFRRRRRRARHSASTEIVDSLGHAPASAVAGRPRPAQVTARRSRGRSPAPRDPTASPALRR